MLLKGVFIPITSKKEIKNYLTTFFSDYIIFKRVLIKNLLVYGIELYITPAFINPMIVYKAFEYYNILYSRDMITNPAIRNINVHKIWLPDVYDQAVSVATEYYVNKIEDNSLLIPDKY